MEEYILTDEQKRILGYIISTKRYTIDEIRNYLIERIIHVQNKIIMLYPDETEYKEIDEIDIVEDSISYSDSSQKGERKSLSFTLINNNDKYTPTSNKKRGRYLSENIEHIYNKTFDYDEIWGDIKFAYYVGIRIGKEIIYFKKGVYCIKSISCDFSSTDQKIQFSLGDKYIVLSGKQGTLLDTYEIPVGSDAINAIKDLFSQSMGNGYIYDVAPILFQPQFANFKTQATIRKEAGDTIDSIIDDIATQMSAMYYYNDNGNFVLENLDETISDTKKIRSWNYTNDSNDLLSFQMNYDFSSAVNVVKVVGDNMNLGLYSATLKNNDERSPICVQRIGYRKEPPITNCNIWNNTMAIELGQYYLRQKSIVPLECTATVLFNPLLDVDTICTISNDQFNFDDDEFVINSITYNADGTMTLKLNKIEDLDFIKTRSDSDDI